MAFFAVMVSKDGRSWLLQHVYAGVQIFHSVEKAKDHMEAIRAPGVEFRVIRLNAEVVE